MSASEARRTSSRPQGAKASLEGVKGSGAMEENSPIVMILTMEEDEDTGEVTGKLEVAKTRDGTRAVGPRAIKLIGCNKTFSWREADSDAADYQPAPRASHGDGDSLGDMAMDDFDRLRPDDDDPFAGE